MKETRSLEFKESITNTFLKTVSAFANYGSGQIKFGVTDEGEDVGVQDPKQACLAIENKINDSISPVPDFSLEVNRRTKVITLAVKEGLHKPYFYRGKAYRRSDTSTVEVDRTELMRLVLEGQNLAFENCEAGSQDLTFSYLEDKLRESLGVSAVTDDVLRTLELMDDTGKYNIAGELFADTNGLPGLDIVRFGNSIDVMLDRETLKRMSVLAQYDQAVGLYRRYYQYEVIDGMERSVKEDVPEVAFREAVANALVHRQWDVDSDVRISMHPDRIEVSSPGGLPHGLSEREYLEGQVSKMRNPIVGNVFFRLRIIERFGTGVLRIKDAYRSSAKQPIFDVFENSIKITLPIMREMASLSLDEQKVRQALEGKLAPISEVVRETGFGKTKVQKILRKLVDSGYASVSGSGRGTKYAASSSGGDGRVNL